MRAASVRTPSTGEGDCCSFTCLPLLLRDGRLPGPGSPVTVAGWTPCHHNPGAIGRLFEVRVRSPYDDRAEPLLTGRNIGRRHACTFLPEPWIVTMMMFLLLFLLMADTAVRAQQWVAQQDPGSLKKMLRTAKDTQRVNLLNLLARRDMYMDFDNTVQASRSYIDTAFSLSLHLGYTRGLGNSYLNKGILAQNSGRFAEALAALQEAIPLVRQAGDQFALAASYDFTGLALQHKGESRKALAYFDSAQALYSRLGDTVTSAWSMINVGNIYWTLGDYTNAYKYGQAAYDRTPERDTTLKTVTLYYLAKLFLSNGLPELTLDQARKVAVYFPSRDTRDNIVRCYPGLATLILGGEAFLELGQLDSALKMAAMTGPPRNKEDLAHLLFWGRLHIAQQQYGKALPYFQQALARAKQRESMLSISQAAGEVAGAYLNLGDYRRAVDHAQQALQAARRIDALPEMTHAASTLSEIYDRLKDYDKAYYYSKLQKSMNDSLMPQEYRRKLALVRVQDELALQKGTAEWLARESQLKEQQLKRETLMKNLLLVSLLLVVIIGVVVLRNLMLKRNNEKLRLKQKAATLEMQALRAQMNPHFIFNSLNSINRFIMQNDKALASQYLTRFSRLVRLILQNSQAERVPLERELEALQLYLDLEALRFDHHFDFSITVDPDIEADILQVPPLLIQPYAENAIWHGLMHKDQKGHLDIDITQQEEILYYRIADDGIGRQKATELKSRSGTSHHSMGMRITADRVALLQEQNLTDTSIRVNDLVLPDGAAAGTEVVLKIPARYD